ncbi:MAG TPA: hypothetical protein PK869_06735 [Candidatus Hydrogenedentes bacterium]|nr:hypothetical protein [Candidatus Hydrogenedentota bacterium]
MTTTIVEDLPQGLRDTFEAWKDSDGDRHREDLGFKDIRDPQYVESLLKNLAQQARIEVLPRQP